MCLSYCTTKRSTKTIRELTFAESKFISSPYGAQTLLVQTAQNDIFLFLAEMRLNHFTCRFTLAPSRWYLNIMVQFFVQKQWFHVGDDNILRSGTQVWVSKAEPIYHNPVTRFELRFRMVLNSLWIQNKVE